MTYRLWTALLSMVFALVVGGTGTARPAAAVAPTGVPVLLAPAYGDDPSSAEPITANPELRWSAVPSAVKYRVEVSTSAGFSPVVFSTDTVNLRFTPTAELPLGQLYWRVAATDGTLTGVGEYAGSTFVKTAATQPTLISPVDDQEDPPVLAYPQAPVLRWSPVAGVKNYRVELAQANDFIGTATVVTTTANTSLALSSPLIFDKVYHWRVQGVSATGGVTTNFSPTGRFTVNWAEAVGAPVLRWPVSGYVGEVTDVVEVTDVAFR
ncbi:MAG TPA: hypothetical protein VF755_09165 [Catenuloplanes sp.]|jgi:hypothetical protein